MSPPTLDMRRALITGRSGQDGSLLAELLTETSYEVTRTIRRSTSLNTDRIDHLCTDLHEGNPRLRLHYGRLADCTSLVPILREVQDEPHHPHAQSHARVRFQLPEFTTDVTGNDFVIASAEDQTLREFCELASAHVSLDRERDVRVDERYFRPSEVDDLLRNAPEPGLLGWNTGFELPGPRCPDGRHRMRRCVTRMDYAAPRSALTRCAESGRPERVHRIGIV